MEALCKVFFHTGQVKATIWLQARLLRCGILGLKRYWLFSLSCPGSRQYCGGAVDLDIGRDNLHFVCI
jgi:hypothetical protein